MKIVIPLVLLIVECVLSICFFSLEGPLLGFHWRTEALIGTAVGALVSLYLISMLVLYLVEKIQTRDGKRFLVGCFIILFALLWRVNLVNEAKSRVSPDSETANIGMSSNTNTINTAQRNQEIDKILSEKIVIESRKASAEVVDRLNLPYISNEYFSSKEKLANVLKVRRKGFNEVSRGMLLDEIVKATNKAVERVCNEVKETYSEINCSELLAEQQVTPKDFKEMVNNIYDFKEAESAFAQFVLDNYESFTFGPNGIESVSLRTEALQDRFKKLANDYDEKLKKI